MKKISIFINIAPYYRRKLFLSLLKEKSIKLDFYYGNSNHSGIKQIDFNAPEFFISSSQLHPVKNIWFFHKILGWQNRVILTCLKSDINIAIFTGEMYCISTWIAAISCRIRKIKVVFWGHGIYGNEGKIKLFARKLFYKLANYHLLYERYAKQLMIKNGFSSDTLYIIFNSLDYDTHKSLRKKFQRISKEEIFNFFKNPMLPVLIFIGRLTNEKKISLLLTVVEEFNRHEEKANLIIIGDGQEKENLLQQGKNGLKNGWLHFAGAIYDEEITGKYLYCSDLCISPGNVGLTAIHSLSFGTPVCSHSNFYNQGPEIGSIIDNYNGFLFEENNLIDLKNKISNWLEKNLDRNLIREQCYQLIDKYYNPSYQLQVLKRLINSERPEL